MKPLTETTPESAYSRVEDAMLTHNPLESLAQLFTKLLDPALDELVLYHYIYVLQNTLTQDRHDPITDVGWHPLEQAWVDAGIVDLMMTIGKGTKTSKWPALTSFFALHSVWDLMRYATIDQRRKLLRQVLDHNIVQICMSKIEHELAIHRNVAVIILRCLAMESFLGETLSARQCSDIIVALCEHILSGPEFYSRQFGDPETTWQTLLCFGQFDHSPQKGSKYAPRYFGMSQENAGFAIQGLLMTTPRLSQQFYYDIVEHNPKVLDLMFKCASLPRFPWYPECQVDGLLSESLTLLLRVPHGLVPGLKVTLDHDAQKAAAGEWDLVLKGINLLVNRPKGLKHIMEVWDSMEDEKIDSILSMIKNVDQYHAMSTPGMDSFLTVFEYRGSVRACMERLIATASHANADTEISTSDLFSLLRITNQALRGVTPNGQSKTLEEKCASIESDFEIFRKPLSVVCSKDEVEPQMQVGDETITGPTAHARVLTLLANRGVLSNASRRTGALKGVSPRMTLPQLRQITSDAALRKFAALGRRRLTERKDKGLRRFKNQNDIGPACVAYFTAAELAAALIAFDDATQNVYSSQMPGVRRDLVLCLGNAAQMALHLEHYDRALCYSMAAVQCVQDLPVDDGPEAVSATIRQKNEYRLHRAREFLAGRS